MMFLLAPSAQSLPCSQLTAYDIVHLRHEPLSPEGDGNASSVRARARGSSTKSGTSRPLRKEMETRGRRRVTIYDLMSFFDGGFDRRAEVARRPGGHVAPSRPGPANGATARHVPRPPAEARRHLGRCCVLAGLSDDEREAVLEELTYGEVLERVVEKGWSWGVACATLSSMVSGAWGLGSLELGLGGTSSRPSSGARQRGRGAGSGRAPGQLLRDACLETWPADPWLTEWRWQTSSSR